MRVVWLVSVTMPQAARLFGLEAGIGGGWLESQLEALRTRCSVTVIAVNPQVKTICQGLSEGVEYILLPRGSLEEFVAVLGRVQPALVHIWGTEYPAAATLGEIADPDHTLVSIQGVMTACARHLNDGVPEKIIRSTFWQRLLDGFVPGHLPDKMQEEFDASAQREQAFLKNVRHLTGRTAWDKEEMSRLAPQAAYYHCGEVLRAPFYQAPVWQRKDFGQAPVLFLPAGNYPLKGLHRLIPALAKIKQVYPGVKLRIAGWKPVDKGSALRWLTDAIFPYETWCRKTAQELGVWENIEYTGPLSCQEMIQAYLDADCVCVCSSVENSPNSLGEAMLLGVPCVASQVGGIPSMVNPGEDCLLYPAPDSDALADRILQILREPALAARLGSLGRVQAAKTYSLDNTGVLYDIYGQILDAQAPLDYKGGAL